MQQKSKQPEKLENPQERLLALVSRLRGNSEEPKATSTPQPTFDPEKIAHLRTKLLALSHLAPQPRGFAFEEFLKQLFDLYGLEPRECPPVGGAGGLMRSADTQKGAFCVRGAQLLRTRADFLRSTRSGR
jgi:hypothetical protein